ncbi:MAG: hypothetical protein E7495_08680, partial [Ruminococcus flavefaciens]|nr:hypothetical protein [Ruminococcus flavefaciens]
MLIMAGICLAVTIFSIFSYSSKTKKFSMFIMGTSAAMMMFADRYAYIYRAVESSTGYYMVRICNFLVFFFVLLIQYSSNWYLSDKIIKELRPEWTEKKLCPDGTELTEKDKKELKPIEMIKL